MPVWKPEDWQPDQAIEKIRFFLSSNYAHATASELDRLADHLAELQQREDRLAGVFQLADGRTHRDQLISLARGALEDSEIAWRRVHQLEDELRGVAEQRNTWMRRAKSWKRLAEQNRAEINAQKLEDIALVIKQIRNAWSGSDPMDLVRLARVAITKLEEMTKTK